MKSIFIGMLVGAVLASGTAGAGGQLHIYNYRGYASPKLVEKFSQTYDVEITIDEFETEDEMLPAVRAGDTGYDAIMASSWAVQQLIDEGLLAETRPNLMENFKNVDPRWVGVGGDPDRNFSVPWHWGTYGLAVDTSVYDGQADSFELLFEPPPELQGRINISPSGDVIFAALRYLGRPPCNDSPADFEALTRLLTTAKRFWRSIKWDYEGMVMGDTALSYYPNGDALLVRREKSTWKYIYPREGYTVWMDNLVVLKDAPNLENARLLQNFVMDPENTALNSDYTGYANAILGSERFLPPDFLEAPEIKPPANAPAPEIVPLCPQSVREKYDQIWAEVRK